MIFAIWGWAIFGLMALSCLMNIYKRHSDPLVQTISVVIWAGMAGWVFVALGRLAR